MTKPITGYEGYYEVSDDGRIFSCDRVVENYCWGKTRYTHYKAKELKHYPGHMGYRRVRLSVNSKYKTFAVHRLVALAFVYNPNKKPDVNHKDGNKVNNQASNLEWCTKKENHAHAVKTGLRQNHYPTPIEHRRSPLKPLQVLKIRKLYATGKYNYCELAEMFGVGNTCIGGIVRRNRWKDI